MQRLSARSTPILSATSSILKDLSYSFLAFYILDLPVLGPSSIDVTFGLLNSRCQVYFPFIEPPWTSQWSWTHRTAGLTRRFADVHPGACVAKSFSRKSWITFSLLSRPDYTYTPFVDWEGRDGFEYNFLFTLAFVVSVQNLWPFDHPNEYLPHRRLRFTKASFVLWYMALVTVMGFLGPYPGTLGIGKIR